MLIPNWSYVNYGFANEAACLANLAYYQSWDNNGMQYDRHHKAKGAIRFGGKYSAISSTLYNVADWFSSNQITIPGNVYKNDTDLMMVYMMGFAQPVLGSRLVDSPADTGSYYQFGYNENMTNERIRYNYIKKASNKARAWSVKQLEDYRYDISVEIDSSPVQDGFEDAYEDSEDGWDIRPYHYITFYSLYSVIVPNQCAINVPGTDRLWKDFHSLKHAWVLLNLQTVQNQTVEGYSATNIPFAGPAVGTGAGVMNIRRNNLYLYPLWGNVAYHPSTVKSVDISTEQYNAIRKVFLRLNIEVFRPSDLAAMGVPVNYVGPLNFGGMGSYNAVLDPNNPNNEANYRRNT